VFLFVPSFKWAEPKITPAPFSLSPILLQNKTFLYLLYTVHSTDNNAAWPTVTSTTEGRTSRERLSSQQLRYVACIASKGVDHAMPGWLGGWVAIPSKCYKGRS
jgi:hypothetical protein